MDIEVKEAKYSFSPLPMTDNTVELFTCLTSKNDDDKTGLIKLVRQAMIESLSAKHSKEDINAFLNSVSVSDMTKLLEKLTELFFEGSLA